MDLRLTVVARVEDVQLASRWTRHTTRSVVWFVVATPLRADGNHARSDTDNLAARAFDGEAAAEGRAWP